MANVSYGNMITELKGKTRGAVYQKNNQSRVQRKHVVPGNPQSASQQNGRNAIKTLSQEWALLTESQRQAYNAEAIAPLDGYHLFIKQNYDLKRFGYSLKTAPIYFTTPGQLCTIQYFGLVNNPTLSFTLSYQRGYDAITVDWGDGNMTIYPTANTFNASHTYTGLFYGDAKIYIPDNKQIVNLTVNPSSHIDAYVQFSLIPHTLILAGQKITDGDVNGLLGTFNSSPNTFGYLDLSGQTPPAPPFGFGITDKAELIRKCWTVLTD